LPSIWQVEIEPYLEEFFFDRLDQVALWRWSTVKARLGF
jgi:5-methylcytosine-specific restriction protein B